MTEEIEKSALGHVAKKKRKVPEKVWKTAMSLKPGPQLMDLLLLPKPTERCLAMRDAWRFNLPIREMTLADVAAADWNGFTEPTPQQAPDYLNGLKLTVKQINYFIKQAKKECIKCGETFPPALDFHHRDKSEKLFEISDFNKQQWGKQRNLQELYDEISKCDVLCATCHRKVEYGGFSE